MLIFIEYLNINNKSNQNIITNLFIQIKRSEVKSRQVSL